MRRILAIAAATAAALCCGLSQSQARGNAPWCAVVNVGGGNVVWDCYYNSVEECRPNVIAGNRGFCNLNPAWGRPKSRRYRDW
jgi:Protein of unknown function (DUF3551)